MMLSETLDELINRLRKEDKLPVSRSIWEASERLWDEGWEAVAVPKSTNALLWRLRGTELETKETRRWVVLAHVVKSLESRDAEFRVVAIRWLDGHASDIAENDRMVTEVLSALLKRVDSASERAEEVRRAAREASVRIWSGAWKHETTRQAVLAQVLKTLQENSSEEEIRVGF